MINFQYTPWYNTQIPFTENFRVDLSTLNFNSTSIDNDIIDFLVEEIYNKLYGRELKLKKMISNIKNKLIIKPFTMW